MEKRIQQNRLTLLAISMKNGDRTAAAELYDALNLKVYGFFFTRTGGRREVAEDLTQDIFVRLVERVGSFDEQRGGFVVWFWQMARHMLVDHYRAKKETLFSAYEDGALESMATMVSPNLDDRLKYLKIQEFLKDMEDDERELFELRYVVGLPYKEISEILGKNEGALRVAALRIRGKIKKEDVWTEWETGNIEKKDSVGIF